ncbi:MAG TPA: NAD(P)/FAD-dependent oxidoreductase [Pyrinomonadaceae bacterium]|jgi:C-3',4' desaturase CrtD
MADEVVVVGGGIGGLTTAALLAARGVRVCLLERESRVGGCAASHQQAGYEFEPGASLYASWQPGGLHERVFAELPVAAPEVRAVSPSYVVRLPDGAEIAVSENEEEFEESLRRVFPECAEAARSFYRQLAPLGAALKRTALRAPDLVTASRLRRLRAAGPEARLAPQLLSMMNRTAASQMAQTSPRFRRFIDAQLQLFAQCDGESCAYLYAAVALTLARERMYTIRGGGSALAETLSQSIKQSGGTVRLNATALRLAYDAGGECAGVELLSGEIVGATRAVVSNLTVWDTYGKLVGPTRTPDAIRRRLKNLRGWGAYLLFLGMDEEAAARLPAERILALTDWQQDVPYDPEQAQLMFASAPAWDTRAPSTKRAVTVSAFTEASQWFAYHEDESEHEAQDQAMLENCWERLHRALPELGDRIEVIETATPRTFYEQTRRRLGMVGGVGQSLEVFGPNSITHRTALRNLYLVGDTTFPGQGLAAVTQSALIVANELARRP